MDLVGLRKGLEAQKYVFDEEFLITVHIALKLGKPLLIEGAAGVGKTEVAKVLASIFGTELIRLQCYEGLDESRALYEWNYQKQLLRIQLEHHAGNTDTADRKGLEDLYTEDFLHERPLLKAINRQEPTVLLIDEIDKTDEEFEAFLLELLSDFQVSIPEFGTIKAKNTPVVILTSNNSRQLSDALKRRCAYLYLDFPSVEKEIAIIRARMPGVPDALAEQVVQAIHSIRENKNIFKKPSISETLDWMAALTALGKKRLDGDGIGKTLGFVLKNWEDIVEFQKDDGFHGLLSKKHH